MQRAFRQLFSDLRFDFGLGNARIVEARIMLGLPTSDRLQGCELLLVGLNTPNSLHLFPFFAQGCTEKFIDVKHVASSL